MPRSSDFSREDVSRPPYHQIVATDQARTDSSSSASLPSNPSRASENKLALPSHAFLSRSRPQKKKNENRANFLLLDEQEVLLRALHAPIEQKQKRKRASAIEIRTTDKNESPSTTFDIIHDLRSDKPLWMYPPPATQLISPWIQPSLLRTRLRRFISPSSLMCSPHTYSVC